MGDLHFVIRRPHIFAATRFEPAPGPFDRFGSDAFLNVGACDFDQATPAAASPFRNTRCDLFEAADGFPHSGFPRKKYQPRPVPTSFEVLSPSCGAR
jgi:hypothetical protein